MVNLILDRKPVQPLFPDAAFDIVALAASAGGLKALGQVLAALPGDFPAAIVVVQHLAPQRPSLLAALLNRQAQLRIQQAQMGDRLQVGTALIAPPDWHLLVQPDGLIALTHTERIHFSRPAADRLFESVAESFQQRSIAVVLTGMGQDGAIGIQKIKALGGTTIAQNRESSEYFSMPDAAIQTQAVDWILPLEQIAVTLMKLVRDGRGSTA
jgi:two-component system, chemotaxis family, protein-glutamate methylesterase/glutaminase